MTPTGDGKPLDEDQQELLERALAEGYFQVPRELSLVELAADTGLDDREASRELRRALDTVLREYLTDTQAGG